MSEAIILTGRLAGALVRRKRQGDGAIFRVCGIIDTNRGAKRYWRGFINNPTLIEQVEELRIGEPLCASSPFKAVAAGERAAEQCALAWRDAGKEVIRLMPGELGDFNDLVPR